MRPWRTQIVGERVVGEDVFFFYDKLPRRHLVCLHGVSIYKPCEGCPADVPEPEENA